MEKRIVIAGSGGQGVLFIGKLLAYSGMLEGKEVTCFPSYGAEMRGGTANCTVIISDDMIGSPVIRNPDILVVMNDASYNRFLKSLIPDGILIYDSSLINTRLHREDVRNIEVPASGISASLKDMKSANMAIMGALIAVSGILNIDSILSAVEEITPAYRKNSIALNKDIIMKGYKLLLDHEDKKSKNIRRTADS